MNSRKFLPLVWIVIISACNNSQQENSVTPDKKEDSAKISESIRSNLSFINDMNAMEAVFSNDNWQSIEGKDTAYLYFSRLGDLKVNTYQYRIIKGDSAQVVHGTMQTAGNDITWTYNGTPLHIKNASSGRVVWSAIGNDSLQYEFIRTDHEHLTMTGPGNKKIVLKKMLPLSLFLVRSYYDYSHGTKLAFDTTQYNRRKSVIVK